MNSKTILLTGASGFIGSHLAEDLLSANYRVVALVRRNSDLWRCQDFENKELFYVYLDDDNFVREIELYNPDVLIHSAWGGVSMSGRNDWNTQVRNIVFSTKVFTLAHEVGIKKIIALGSQAEYGVFEDRINEDAPCRPVTAYGAAKLATLDIFKSYCEVNGINWFWLRLFSLYGTRENPEWLISSAVHNMYHGKPMDMTPGEQRYDYLYIKDFSKAVRKVVESTTESGVYNLGSDTSIQLKDLVTEIRSIVNPGAVLNFGALPYRNNQVMRMEGDSSRFNRHFDFSVQGDYKKNLIEVVNYCIDKFKTKVYK